MTKIHRYGLLTLLLTIPIAHADDTDTDTPETDTEKQKTENVHKDEFTYSFNDIRDQLVVIEHENGTGSGFVAKMDDKYYIFTNQHVIFGATKVSFKSVSGETLKPKKVELSATRDIARLLLDADAGLEISNKIEMDAPVGVFGNSDGAGVATELYGVVNGIGGELIEVSADFVSGNSGSPVLNTDKEVIGIASYVRFSGSSRSKKGTKFENKTRRFCYRVADSEWLAVNWGKYNKKYGAPYFENEQFITCLENIYSSWDGDISNRVMLDTGSDRRILSWSQSHNLVTSKYRGQGKFRAECAKSLSRLGSICKTESNNIRHFLDEEERYLTGFLRDEYRRQANTLHAYEELSTYVSGLFHR